jgi:DNA replication protein DnaC
MSSPEVVRDSDAGDNEMLIRKEAVERRSLAQGNDFSFLYPNLNDPEFNIKIAERQEFFDTKYEGDVLPVEEQAEKLCNAEMELAPYQVFVRNFLSFQTPYNSLLLYHGLGSGKTCSAIGVGEEMRDYNSQMGITKRIIVVASPNVQDNFKQALFDERKLVEVDGLWTLKGCTGNRFLREINPMNMKGLSRDKVVMQVRRIIQGSYLFLGYIEFANLITKKAQVESSLKPAFQKEQSDRKLRKFFDDRLLIIDEVHNIRMTDDNKNKRVAVSLQRLVSTARNLRLLLLSATPMYNSYREIVWLINLMNINDRRATFDGRDVFDSAGAFVEGKDGRESGRELLMRKATGYVSFVRGENPYTFPYRVFPKQFDPDRSILLKEYPKTQIAGGEIASPIQFIDVYADGIGDYQLMGYDYILEGSIGSLATLKGDPGDKFGYTFLQPPLEALIIVFPVEGFEPGVLGDDRPQRELLIGKQGLSGVMDFTQRNTIPPVRTDFKYKPWVLEQHGRIFSPGLIGNFSSKIKSVCDSILNSTGIVLVYSQYIDGGIVPMALALEELGFREYGGKSLLSSKNAEELDSLSMKSRSGYTGDSFVQASYAVITGDKALSPDNSAVMRAVTAPENNYGKNVKVVLISRAGSEGLDFSNIRQVHILDPWYNMNRNEQIIGRAVRNKSHCSLPFSERNVEIFLHGTVLPGQSEAADLYMYRLAESKAVTIGRVSRALKESAVDCLLNTGQNNFTLEDMAQTVNLRLASGKRIAFQVGDKPHTSSCDYMDTCGFKCRPSKVIDEADVKLDSYNESFIFMNSDKIMQRIKQAFRDQYSYEKQDLIRRVSAVREYPLVQVYAALDKLVTDSGEHLTDRYGRLGHLVNIDDRYYFQPIELRFKRISMLERSTPIPYKRQSITVSLPTDVTESALGKAVQGKLEGAEVELPERIEARNLVEASRKDYQRAMGGAGTEDDWYAMCAKLRSGALSRVSQDTVSRLVVAHIVEMLMASGKLLLLGYLTNREPEDDFEVLLKEYFQRMTMVSNNLQGVLLEKGGVQVLYVSRGSVWMEGEPQDYKDMRDQIMNYVVPVRDLSLTVGFIAGFKGQYMIFKVKDMTLARHKGARCDQAGKTETLKQLNKVLGDERYTRENTKKTVQFELCVLLELLLRLKNVERSEGKRWFLSPEEAVVNRIAEIKI